MKGNIIPCTRMQIIIRNIIGENVTGYYSLYNYQYVQYCKT